MKPSTTSTQSSGVFLSHYSLLEFIYFEKLSRNFLSYCCLYKMTPILMIMFVCGFLFAFAFPESIKICIT